MKEGKPLGVKNYGSIGHLPNSRLGPKDYSVGESMGKIFFEKTKQKSDIVIVQEKLDGCNVGVCKVDGVIYPIQRSGYIANTSQYIQHKAFYMWVMNFKYREFDKLLNDGERVVGEWLALAHGTKYDLTNREPFVAFDIFDSKNNRICYEEFTERIFYSGLEFAKMINDGKPISVFDVSQMINVKGEYGALEPIEGFIYRLERNNKVLSLAKFVFDWKVDGKYLDKEVWNKPYLDISSFNITGNENE